MCEYSGKLIAWLDQELPPEEATNVEWHVNQCAACRKAVDAYQEVSGVFLACYEATMTARPRRNMHLWAWSGVAAAAAIVAVFFMAPPAHLAPPRAEKLSFHPPAPPPAPILEVRAPVHSRPHALHPPIQRQWVAAEPTIQVALPADALFPPGAVPEGFSFIADVRFQQ
jgi:hypothetical protein